MDEAGYHAVSLLSGHIGGANALAKKVAEIIGAVPVITTATDINNVPAIDVIAKEKELVIENPDAIKTVSMALLNGKPVALYDPFGLIGHEMNQRFCPADKDQMACSSDPGVFIDDIQIELPPHVLILRPRSLAAGMGCNRNTGTEEMKSLLYEVLEKFGLSLNSLNSIATIDAKKDEPGLLALAEDLELPLIFFDKQALNQVKDIQTPSEMVEKHMGVKSVCEAAAILASKKGTLIVPKHSTRNVTAAIARMSFTS
jgi:cobalt-precorrin 5A hydrolase